MNKEQLVAQITEKTTVTKKVAYQILDALTDSIIESVSQGEKITLVGFGSFGLTRQERKTRKKSSDWESFEYSREPSPCLFSRETF